MTTTVPLEREAPLASLVAAVDDAVAGRGGIVLISGEAGIGKTTLVRAFTGELSSGPRVLIGSCDDLLAPRTLGALRDAVSGTDGRLEHALTEGSTESAMTAAVAEFAGPSPTVLVVEDLHWADDATLDLLGHLSRRIEGSFGLLVLTFRDDELPIAHPLRRLLGIVASSSPTRIRLEPLSEAAVAELVGADGRDVAALHSTTGGNPFYVVEALAAAPEDVSPTVAATVLARVHRLQPSCRAALEKICVATGPIEYSLAETLLGGPLDVLGEAEERRILRTTSTGIAFRHELTRRAIEDGVSAIARRAAHRAMTEALLADPPIDIARVVHHATSAGDNDTVVRFAPTAGRDAAAAGAHRQALVHYEAALATGLLDPAEHAVVQGEYAWELYNAHRIADAVAASRQAVALHRDNGAEEAAGETLVGLSHQLLLAGDPEGANAAIEEAVAVLERSGTPSSRAYAATYRGTLLLTAEALGPAAPVLEEALTLAQEAQRGDLVALCTIYLALCNPVLDPSDRIAMLRIGIADAIRHGAHEGAGRGYTILAELLLRFGQLDDLEECLAEGAAFTFDHDLGVYSVRLDILRCQHLMRRGEWEAAERGLQEALESADVGMFDLLARANLARIRTRRGAAGAAEMVTDTFTRAIAGKWLLGLAYSGLAFVESTWLTGHSEQSAALASTWSANSAHPVVAGLYGELLRYSQRAGHPAEVFDGCPEPWAAGLRGEWRNAAEQWARIGDPYEEALELADSGEVGPTMAAWQKLVQLGADAAADIVRKRLRNMGVHRLPHGPRPTTTTNRAGLTQRQVEVLDQLRDGLTNTEIASRLTLSVRTVDHHVSAILAKLNVSTRREAVAIAKRWAVGESTSA
ncbi:AAA family ATPase [Antrihabitans sp. YC3-6]|uniref:AAA family ATPase n=1 Tax=Antrihabitans stalagmiti TaxID=2799499 RepID=A0A934NMV6_9NOCA|nr:LuxR family transcriptional regulator [Antrihabitans stalagmiti]MBJ8338171.1 AAA family ATPase [Antrihabitans stalagmiti]